MGIRAGVRTGRNMPSSVEFASTTAGSNFVLGPTGCGSKSVITVSETCVSCSGFRRLAGHKIVCIAGVGGGLMCRILSSVVCVSPYNLVRCEIRIMRFGGRVGSKRGVERGTHVIACISLAGGGPGIVSLLAGSVSVSVRSVVTVCHGE